MSFSKIFVSPFVLLIILLPNLFFFSEDYSLITNFEQLDEEGIFEDINSEEIFNSIVQKTKIPSNNDYFAPNDTGNTSWTYMLYLDADNDIEADAIRDFEWLEEAGGSDENVSIVVLLDRISGFDSTHGNWDGSRYYYVTEDVSSNTIDSQLLVDLGEVDMGNPQTLRNFIEYCFVNFSAENYILDLWDHGHGASSVCDDETSGSWLTMDEVQTAISEATSVQSEKIEIISMDACNMNTIEVAWEIRNLCDYFISSEEGTNGYHYLPLIEGLKSNPVMNASALCELMVETYANYYAYWEGMCISVIQQENISSLPSIFDGFVMELINTLESNDYNRLFAYIRKQSQDFRSGEFVDLINLLENIEFFIDDPSLILASEYLRDLLEQLIVYNWQQSDSDGRCNGVSIYMPYDESGEMWFGAYIDRVFFYEGMDWQVDTMWDEFMVYYETNQLYMNSIEPPIFTLGEVVEDCTLQQNEIKIYEILSRTDAIYEFKCLINSGDVDLKIALVSFGSRGNFRLIGGSYLINPEDGSTECCRSYIEFGFYYSIFIIVYGKASTSNFDLAISIIDPEDLVCNDPQTLTGGSLNGDETDHFKQDLSYYYQISIPYGINTILITNSETINTQLTIFDENWNELFYESTAGFGEIISLQYNHTRVNSTIFILEICGIEGSGSFTIEVKNPNEPTPKPKVGLYFLGLFMFIPFIMLLKRKKK